MYSAKRYLAIAAMFAVSLLVFAVFNPRVAHAITATLVQVTNSVSNPVPVRNIDEPARVPYYISAKATCSFTNECLLAGTQVPAGMRLRITRISGFVSANVTAFAALSTDNDISISIVAPAVSVNAAYFGTMQTFNQEVDFYVDEGHTPELQLGSQSTINNAIFQNLTMAGYLVNKEP